jgi:serine/threonine protein kinase/HEAT repeat protein/Tfp pilus assembly protein PilF
MNEQDFLYYLAIQERLSFEDLQKLSGFKSPIEQGIIEGVFTQEEISQWMSVYILEQNTEKINKNSESLLGKRPFEQIAPTEILKREELIEKEEATTDLSEREELRFSSQILLDFQKRYKVLSTLGEGGMSVVQEVYDRLLGREVALKRVKLNPEGQRNKTQQMLLWRLNQEAEITAILEHPNIVPLYEMQQRDEHEICFTMRKIKGKTLRQVIQEEQEKREAGLQWNEAFFLSIFLKVGDAVAYAHAKGVIHRDLKPSNIMVGAFGEVYVVDWGIAKKYKETASPSVTTSSVKFKFQSSHDQTVGGLGTRGYMAPEQQQEASQVSPQADIYALGMILREGYTGLSPLEELKNKMNQDLLQFKEKKAGTLDSPFRELKIPLDIQAIEKKACAFLPEARYFSVSDLQRDIESYLQNTQVSARSYSYRERFLKWMQRKQRALKFFLGIFVSVLGVAFLFSFFYSYQTQQRYDFFYQKSQHYADRASTLEASATERIVPLLEGLRYIHQALSLFPHATEALQLQQQLSQEVVETACETQQYSLAEYIASSWTIRSPQDRILQEDFFKKIEERRFAVKQKHLERFNFWKTRLQQTLLEQGEREEALLEISKMEEDEVYENLVLLVQEALKYFFQEKEHSPLQTVYYRTMTLALSKQQRSKSSPFFWESFRQSSDLLRNRYLEALPPLKEKEALEYLLIVAQGLRDSKIPFKAEAFEKIRQQLHSFPVFFEASFSVFRDLTVLDAQRVARNATEYFHRAYARGVQKDFQGALHDYTQAIELQASFGEAYYKRGQIRSEMQQYRQALQDYHFALQLNPELTEIYESRASVYEKREEWTLALNDYQVLLKQGKTPFYFQGKRGDILWTLQRFEEALTAYEQALALSPPLEKLPLQWYFRQGQFYFQKKQWDKALPHFQKVVDSDPSTLHREWWFQTYLARAQAYQAEEKWDLALKDWSQILQWNPQYPEAFLARAQIYEELQEDQNALDEYYRLLQFFPAFRPALIQRGQFYFQRGFAKEALKDYTQALQQEQIPDLMLLEKRGILQETQGNEEAALLDYSYGLLYDPFHLSLLKQRARLLKKQRKYQEALYDYQQATLLPQEESSYDEIAFACSEIYFQQKDWKKVLESSTPLCNRLKPHLQSLFLRGYSFAYLKQNPYPPFLQVHLAFSRQEIQEKEWFFQQIRSGLQDPLPSISFLSLCLLGQLSFVWEPQKISVLDLLRAEELWEKEIERIEKQWGKPLPSLSVLKEELKSFEEKRQIAAIQELEYLGEPALPLLISLLKDPKENLRFEATQVLSRLNPEPSLLEPVLMAFLQHKEPYWRKRVLVLFQTLSVDFALPSLIKALQEESVEAVRLEIVSILGILGRAEALPALIPLLRQSPSPLLYKTRESLKKIIKYEGDATLSFLLKTFKQEEANVKIEILNALRDPLFSHKEAFALFSKTLKEPHVSLRESLFDFFSEAHTDCIPFVLGLLEEKSPYFEEKLPLFLALLLQKAPQYLSLLEKKLGDKDPFVRQRALETLSKMGVSGTRLYPAVLTLLEDSNKRIVKEALEALGALGNPQALPFLIKALEDRDKRNPIRLTAIRALAKLKAENTIPLLLTLLESSKEPAERAVSAYAIGNIGMTTLFQLNQFLDLFEKEEQDLELQHIFRQVLILNGKKEDLFPLALGIAQRMRRSKKAPFRNQLIFILGELGNNAKTAVPELIEHLALEPEVSNRYATIQAFSKIGKEATQKSIPLLLEMLKNEKDEDFKEKIFKLLHDFFQEK